VDKRTPALAQEHWYSLKSKALRHLNKMKETGNLQLHTPDFYRKIWRWFADRDSYVVDGIPFGVDTGEDIDLSTDFLAKKPFVDLSDNISVDLTENTQEDLFDEVPASQESSATVSTPEKPNEVDGLLADLTGVKTVVKSRTPLVRKKLFNAPRSVLAKVTNTDVEGHGLTENLTRKRTATQVKLEQTESKGNLK
jgi:hypothetical protein